VERLIIETQMPASFHTAKLLFSGHLGVQDRPRCSSLKDTVAVQYGGNSSIRALYYQSTCI